MMTGKGLFLINMVWVYTNTSMAVIEKEAHFSSTGLLHINVLHSEKSEELFAF